MTAAGHPGAGEAFLVVRSVVEQPALRPAFDHWYATDHAPLALRLLAASRAWRFWSLTDAAVHYAVYAYKDAAALHAAMASSEIPRLLAEYDSAWPSGVTRTRELIVQADRILPSAG